ncbi:aspartate carbamoyltransferase catalytic subunit [Roseovarius pelagicus]|uniref:Aspartate carbamoyltransferase catalytic subunit n=1 Tax=Roseovarius pelagicus TaxID=2980108 RepID=A0ABY6D642_9RHOB|nr:aspartate carbamoyltransferase catalytic subunit [Roseovarius pelagicus]UXX81614.1 aspartate carbamoyltransferase catalytic subunit [Roseovarius pelagicus]
MTAATGADGWAGILDPGETILWQDRPDSGFTLRPSQIGITLFGMAFAGFALFWMVMASQAGGGFWMFGLIHFSVGVGIIASALMWGPYRRRHTWYTLTDRRAFIATHLPVVGRRLKSYPITEDSVLDFQSGDLSTIIFHDERKRGKNGYYTVKIGFERIRDGEKVYRLMRDAQERAT